MAIMWDGISVLQTACLPFEPNQICHPQKWTSHGKKYSELMGVSVCDGMI